MPENAKNVPESELPPEVVEEAINYTKKRDEEIIPIARELLKVIANTEDLMIGTSETYTQEEMLAFYNKMYTEQVAPIIIEKDIKVNDIAYLFQIMTQAVSLLQSRVEDTVNVRYDTAVSRLLGAEDIDEVRISHIQSVLVDKKDKKDKN